MIFMKKAGQMSSQPINVKLDITCYNYFLFSNRFKMEVNKHGAI